MEIAFILLAIAIIIIIAIALLNHKKSSSTQPHNNEEVTNLDIYNEIIGLRNQTTWTNFWLGLICTILIFIFVIPFILQLAGITYIANELYNVLK